MNQGGFKLNPYAEAYIPVSRREPRPENRPSAFPKQAHSRGMLSERQSEFPISPSYHSGGPSQSVDETAEEQLTYEHFDITMNRLRSQFPDVADDFLAEAYWTNGGDFGAAASMVYELEADADESSESLPDTLDIGDVSESGPYAQFSSLKLKNVPFANESSSDSFGSSRSAS